MNFVVPGTVSELEGILVMSVVGALTHPVALELGAKNLEVPVASAPWEEEHNSGTWQEET